MNPAKLVEHISRLIELPPYTPGGAGIASTEPNHAEVRARLILLALQAIPMMIKYAPVLKVTLYESHPQELCSDGKGTIRVRRMVPTDPNDIIIYIPMRAAHNTKLLLDEQVVLKNYMYALGLAIKDDVPCAEKFAVDAMKDFDVRVASRVPRCTNHLVQMGVLPADYAKMWLAEWNKQWWPIQSTAMTMEQVRVRVYEASRKESEKNKMADRMLRANAALKRVTTTATTST